MRAIIHFIFYLASFASMMHCQDYEVADVKCVMEATGLSGQNQRLFARLRKPENFRGHPLFADDPQINPLKHELCQILPDPIDLTGRIYRLDIKDFSRCGVTHHGDYIHVRVWFPLLPSAMTSHDQEVILVCKPPQATALSSQIAEITSTAPIQARVTGVVEQTYSHLEYRVEIYRRVEDKSYSEGRSLANGIIVNPPATSGPYMIPLSEPIPIGTRLQLRAILNKNGVWKHAKLMEVIVSPDPVNSHADGYVQMVHLGCRTPELRSLMKNQASRSSSQPSEVWLDFEAVLVVGNATVRSQRRGQQWIHTTVLACVNEKDCSPEVCEDSAESVTGYGKRNRRSKSFNSSRLVEFDNKVPFRIILPEDEDGVEGQAGCGLWIVGAGVLVSTTAVCFVSLLLTCYWHSQAKQQLNKVAPHQRS